MRLCSADLSPQATKRTKYPHSLVKNRRREAASPYHSELGAGAPRTIKRCPTRCRTQPAGRQRSPFEEATSSNSSTSMFNVGRSMFDVHPPSHLNAFFILQAIEMRVEAFLVADELLMRTARNDSAVLHDMDHARIANG